MLFEPLKTFSTSVDFSIICRNRGKWRVKMDLDASEPEPDDYIKLVAPVGGSDKVSFKLTNRFLVDLLAPLLISAQAIAQERNLQQEEVLTDWKEHRRGTWIWRVPPQTGAACEKQSQTQWFHCKRQVQPARPIRQQREDAPQDLRSAVST